MKLQFMVCAALILWNTGSLSAQTTTRSDQARSTIAANHKTHSMDGSNTLYQYGVADAFVNGFYEGQLSIRQIKQHGNFGIGAPDLIDGELTMFNGKIYQSNAKGQTFEAPDSLKSPLIFVSHFEPQTMFYLTEVTDLPSLFRQIEARLPGKNSIYAIRVTGRFSQMKTRAFSPVVKKPFKPLAELLDQQHVFDLVNTNGCMIGYYMPGYLAGINIVGLHFHYLSSDIKKGGHVLGLRSDRVQVEIAKIDGFRLSVPDTHEFMNYDFSRDNSSDLNVVEKGGIK